MSPVCMGITVRQWPHLQIWSNPRWHTVWQPAARSSRVSSRAVTAQVYVIRQILVYAVRRQVAGMVFEAGVVRGGGVTHRTPVHPRCALVDCTDQPSGIRNNRQATRSVQRTPRPLVEPLVNRPAISRTEASRDCMTENADNDTYRETIAVMVLRFNPDTSASWRREAPLR
jgi:hypothetical protein